MHHVCITSNVTSVLKSTSRSPTNMPTSYTTTDGTKSIALSRNVYKNNAFHFSNQIYIILSFFVSWDEWVGMKRILKYSDANLRKQRELIEASRYDTCNDCVLKCGRHFVVFCISCNQLGEQQ